MCMLHYLKNNATHAAYVNHGVRTDATQDAELIKKKCEEYGITFHELFINEQIGKRNFEAIAREKRYQLLFELKNKLGADFLATAHHRDDQAETVFLRMARGTGLKGLRGILAEREDGVIRPMLQFTRQDLLEYAKQHGIEWREDSTNKNTEHFRNKVRLEIFPKFDKSIINSLANIAELSQKIYPKLVKTLDSYFNPFLVSCDKETVVLKRYFYLPPIVGYRELFRLWLGSKGISWEETNEDAKFFEKLQGSASFRFRLGRVSFVRKNV